MALPVNAQNTDPPLALAINKKALDFLDAPSDLVVPGVYEGGLIKTWECSLDLVEHLHELQCSSNFGGPGFTVSGNYREFVVRFFLHQ